MTSISPQDIETQLPVILSRVAQGEEFVVTDHGQAVARIIPPAGAAATHADADRLGQDVWRIQFDNWMQDVDARADRYPADYTLDDSRESIYNGRGA